MKIKKILSGAIAAATLVTSVGMFPVSAAYDVCDVNRDGAVNVRDVSAIASYRAGNVYVPNYSQLDADKNLVINSMDEQRVLAKVMGWSYSSSYYSKKNKTTSNPSTVSEFVSSADDSSTAARVYKRYDYKKKKQLSNYTLYPSTTPLTSSVQTRGIIGADDRYMSSGSENTGIIFLVMDRGSNYPDDERYISGTGFIVGDHQIATAAHVVYGENWFTPMTICNYKYNGELYSSNMFSPVEVHIPNNYNPAVSPSENAKWDYALITVEEDLSGFVQFDLGTSYSVNANNFNNIPIYATGCPDKTNTNSDNTTNRLYTGEGKIMSQYSVVYNNGLTVNYALNNTEVLKFDTDTRPGNSGGPVYTVTKNNVNGKASYTYTAIAINSYQVTSKSTGEGFYNAGALVTKYLLQFYENNPNLNY